MTSFRDSVHVIYAVGLEALDLVAIVLSTKPEGFASIIPEVYDYYGRIFTGKDVQ